MEIAFFLSSNYIIDTAFFFFFEVRKQIWELLCIILVDVLHSFVVYNI